MIFHGILFDDHSKTSRNKSVDTPHGPLYYNVFVGEHRGAKINKNTSIYFQ